MHVFLIILEAQLSKQSCCNDMIIHTDVFPFCIYVNFLVPYKRLSFWAAPCFTSCHLWALTLQSYSQQMSIFYPSTHKITEYKATGCVTSVTNFDWDHFMTKCVMLYGLIDYLINTKGQWQSCYCRKNVFFMEACWCLQSEITINVN